MKNGDKRREFRMGSMLLTVAGLLTGVPATQTMASSPEGAPAQAKSSSPLPEALSTAALEAKVELSARYGAAAQARIERGVSQVASLWRPSDGDAAAFKAFVIEYFVGDPATQQVVFERYERILEKVYGHMDEINREMRQQADLDLGPILPVDEIMAAYDPGAHLIDDFFTNKIAFIALLNFPLSTLEERVAQSERWTRQQWAEARLAQLYGSRVPADVNLKIAGAVAEAEQYIAEYNIWMHHLLTTDGKRLFEPGMKLISHWNLRDELKANYAEKDGLVRQQMIMKVMEHIVLQTIPEVVINNPTVDWNPVTNAVTLSPVKDSDQVAAPDQKVTSDREPDTRYAMLLKTFHAARLEDPYSPLSPTHIDRMFNDRREMPEARVTALLESVLTSPLAPKVASLIEKRLGRKLEPFDVYYSGFKARGAYTEDQLDEIVKAKYPNLDAFQKGMPEILVGIGFTPERAAYLSARIVVDPARGAGHAMGAAMRGEKSHLRTRVPQGGMDYKGYNIAIHELGHNVEQTFSLYDVDHTLLRGVPNTAFTEAFAFVFQNRDLELLGLAKTTPETEALHALDDFWSTFEIAGVGMVDMRIWHWMYEHPQATPAELREATVQIAKDVWNRYYAPIFKKKDVVLLAIYSHLIDAMMYTPDYSLGHLISFQISEHLKKSGQVGAEIERMCRTGSIAPDLWMKQATGQPVSAEPLLLATTQALTVVKK